MNSGYEIPGIRQHQQAATENTTSDPVLLSMTQTHFLDQIHTLPASTQQRLFSDQTHFLQHQTRLSHHYVGGGGDSRSAYFPPVNFFKLGLSEICARNNNDYEQHGIDEGGDANLLRRGSEPYGVPEARQSSLGMLHCWQNQQDSTDKQQPSFWEHLPSEVSNENMSEIVDRSQEHNQNEQVTDHHLTTCLDSRNRLHFGELEAIYKRLGTAQSNQTGPCEAEEASAPLKSKDANKKRRKKKRQNSRNRYLIRPMAEFFGNLVKQVMDHQENMHKKFTEAIERLEEERMAREEDWRKQELERFEQESEARAKEKASAKYREAMIVSCLEKITGERINFSKFDPMEIVNTNKIDDL